MFSHSFPGFLLTALLLTMAPGLDTAMVLRSAGADGTRHGIFTALGITLGCLCWGSAASFGLGALLRHWPMAFTAVQWAGAVYLTWLGARLLLARRRASMDVAQVGTGAATEATAFRRGLLTNLLNPKVGLFYVTLLPQFVPIGAPSDSAFRLALAHVVMVLAWFSLLAMLTGSVRKWLRRPAVTAALDRLTGGAFVLLGLQICLSAAAHP